MYVKIDGVTKEQLGKIGEFLQKAAESELATPRITVIMNNDEGELHYIRAITENDTVLELNENTNEIEPYYVLRDSEVEGFYDDLVDSYNYGLVDTRGDLLQLRDLAAERGDSKVVKSIDAALGKERTQNERDTL